MEMNMPFLGRALVAALVLFMHSSWLLWPSAEEERKKKQPPVPVDYIGGVELIAKDEQTGDRNDVRVKCPKTYEGIGLKHGWNGRITEVAKGWPADLAGIRKGDILENPWGGIERKDGYMRFTIIRDGKRTEFNLRSDQICMRDEPVFGGE